MRHAPPFGRRPVGSGRATLMLSLLCVASVLLACGAVASATTLTNGAASALTMSVHIYPDYPDYAPKTMLISVVITDALGHPVNLRNGQKLTCNGVEFPHGRQSLFGSSTVPDDTFIEASPHPPGGAYTFVYTDERGKRTKLVVPVGSTPLQILSPRAGDVIPIPTPQAGLSGTPASTQAPGAQSPDVAASFVVRFVLPESPPGANYNSYAQAGWAIPDCAIPEKRFGFGTCDARSELGFINAATADRSDTGAALTKTVTITDSSPYVGDTFHTFQPGPGWIYVHSRMEWTPATTGFAAVSVEMERSTEIQITWVR